MNQNHSVKIQILSPVHIGAGAEKNWQRGADFVHANGQIYILNQMLVWESLDTAQQNRYIDLLGTGKLKEVEKLLVDNLDLEDVATNIFNYNGTLQSREIKTIMRDGNGSAYIPGSSIKGAIASALFHFLYQNKQADFDNEPTVKDLLGTFDRALGRYIRPYDSSAMETEVNDVDLYNLYKQGTNWQGDYKENFRIVVETFKPDTEGEMRLSLATSLADFMTKKQPNGSLLPKYYQEALGEKPLETLFKIINDYTHTHAQREHAYFTKYNDLEDIDLILEQLEGIMAETEKPLSTTSCILRLSFGSGFHGITGDWRYEDHTESIGTPDRRNLIYNRDTRQKEPARYKSRRLVFPYGGIMGFIKLSL